jgi:hypothetical protein
MIDGFGRPVSFNSFPDNNTSSSPGIVGICDVIAATTRSGRTLFDRSGERTRAGRCFMALRSVNGKGTRTTSPWLKLVVDGILGIVPELERRLGGFEPADIIRLNFQMCRQVVKKPHLITHIQVFDCLADFLNRAHAGNFTQDFSNEKEKKG